MPTTARQRRIVDNSASRDDSRLCRFAFSASSCLIWTSIVDNKARLRSLRGKFVDNKDRFALKVAQTMYVTKWPAGMHMMCSVP